MLQKIVAENVYLIQDRYTLEEMLTFTRNERGRPEAEDGAHDDLVMALAIAYYCRGQQTRKPVPPPKQKLVMADYSPFGIKPEKAGFDDLRNTVDYGQDLLVV
jgi:phage terminase large subunit